jgi:hypothetical protein
MIDGVSLHANVGVPKGDRRRLEKLCRYIARPPVSTERLSQLPDGRLLYRLKRKWRDGTTHVVFEPLELVEKLASIVPPPRIHMVRYHGVFAPRAAVRRQVVPANPPEDASSGTRATDKCAHASVARVPLSSQTLRRPRLRRGALLASEARMGRRALTDRRPRQRSRAQRKPVLACGPPSGVKPRDTVGSCAKLQWTPPCLRKRAAGRSMLPLLSEVALPHLFDTRRATKRFRALRLT